MAGTFIQFVFLSKRGLAAQQAFCLLTLVAHGAKSGGIYHPLFWLCQSTAAQQAFCLLMLVAHGEK